MWLPTHSSEWCRAWEKLTRAMDEELSKAEPDALEVSRLIHERRRWLSLQPPAVPPEAQPPLSEQEAWLRAMIDLDAEIGRKVVELKDDVAGYLRSLGSGASVRRRFQASPRPEATSRLFKHSF